MCVFCSFLLFENKIVDDFSEDEERFVDLDALFAGDAL